MQFSTSLMNPFPELEKAHHVLAIGDEVVYTPTGHRGKLTNVLHGVHYVTMTTGHVIGCSRNDLCPADFPPAERPARQPVMAQPVKRESGPFGDPCGLGETFAKSANSTDGFFVGQRVRDRTNGKFAKITAIKYGTLDLLYEDGNEGSSATKFMEAAA